MSPHSDAGRGSGHLQEHGSRHGSEPGHGDGGPRAAGDGDGGGHRHGSGHRHGHGHQGTDIDWGLMADRLENNGELKLAALRGTAERLRGLLGPERDVRRVLDVGSGPGVMTCVLAETFPGAESVAVDGTPALLDRALARAARLGLGDRVTVRHAELPEGLDGGGSGGGPGDGSDGRPSGGSDGGSGGGDAGLGAADLVWSSMAVHHLGDQQGALDGLARALRPGGLLAVAEGGLPTRFLPRDIGIGRPGLQARLDAVQEEWFAEMRAALPGSTALVEDWPAMLGRAGLTRVGAFTSLLDLPAPLGDAARTFLFDHLTRIRETVGEALDAEDRGVLDVLVDPTAPEGVLRRPDAFLLSATTVFTGLRAAG